LVKNPQLRAEPKIMKGIKSKNKIIISILKLIYPNIASNEKIKKFIEEDNVDYFCVKYMEEIWKNKKEVNRENDISKPKYNSLGIIHLIILLKQNKELHERALEMTNDELKDEIQSLQERLSMSYGEFSSQKEKDAYKDFERRHMHERLTMKIQSGKCPYLIPTGVGIGTHLEVVCPICGEKENITDTSVW